MQETPMEWPTIAGIDASSARTQWAGDAALFTTMLAILLDDYARVDFPSASVTPELLAAFAKNIHKLRGGASMLAATAVVAIAGELEAACHAAAHDRAHDLSKILAEALDQLRRNAAPAIAACRQARPPIGEYSARAVDPEPLRALAQSLRAQCLDAATQMTRLAPSLYPILGYDRYRALLDHIDHLRYDAAAEIIEGCAKGVAPDSPSR